MIHLLAILLALGGFVALALSMTRHQRALAGRMLARGEAQVARVAGYALLALAFGMDALAFGAGYGAVAWCAHLSVGAWLTIAIMHWRKA